MTERLIILFMKDSIGLAITVAIRGSSKEKLYQALNPAAATMIQKTLYLFQNNKQSISQLPL